MYWFKTYFCLFFDDYHEVETERERANHIDEKKTSTSNYKYFSVVINKI